MSGVVQLGIHSLADRYSYVPHLGLMIAVVWGILALPLWQRASAQLQRALVCLVMLGLGALTWVQVWCWQNTESLYRHTLSVTENNVRFHEAYSSLLRTQGKLDEAEKHIARAVEITPLDPRLHQNYGMLLILLERYQDAVLRLEAALRLQPDDGETHYTLGVALDKLGRRAEARKHLEKSIQCWQSQKPPAAVPDTEAPPVTAAQMVGPYLLLGEMALRDGHPDQTVAYVERALAIKPNLLEAYLFKGIALGRLRRWAEAEVAFQTGVRLNPHHPATRGYLAFAYDRQQKTELAAREYAGILVDFPEWVQHTSTFALQRVTRVSHLDPQLAEEAALQVCEATRYRDPHALDALAAVQAAKKDFSAAEQTVRNALSLTSDPVLTHQLQEKLRRYQEKGTLPQE
jgi:Flp pilus assembly protein TadD